MLIGKSPFSNKAKKKKKKSVLRTWSLDSAIKEMLGREIKELTTWLPSVACSMGQLHRSNQCAKLPMLLGWCPAVCTAWQARHHGSSQKEVMCTAYLRRQWK